MPEIAAQFDALKAQAENKVKVTFTSATAADAKIVEQVKQALQQQLGREVELTLEVDAVADRRRDHSRGRHGDRRLGARALGKARAHVDDR